MWDVAELVLGVEGDEGRLDDVLQLQALHLRVLVLDLGQMPEDEPPEAVALGACLLVVDRADLHLLLEDQ